VEKTYTQISIVLIILVNTCFCDEWALPLPQSYYSKSRNFKLTIVPRVTYTHFKERPDYLKKDKDVLISDTCKGYLLKQVNSDTYALVWEKKLVNTVSPVEAMVSDSGFVVTFDEWHKVGHGPNVVVVYNQEGNKIKNYSLESFLSLYSRKRVRQTASSIWWRGDPEIDDAKEILIIPTFSKNIAYWNPKDTTVLDSTKPLYKKYLINIKTGVISDSIVP
jgi:hypothetical protein